MIIEHLSSTGRKQIVAMVKKFACVCVRGGERERERERENERELIITSSHSNFLHYTFLHISFHNNITCTCI